MNYNEQEILDNKSPQGATEVDSTGVYYKYDPKLICDHYVWMQEDSYDPKIEDRWRLMPDGNIEGATLIRAIADIKRIAELESLNDWLTDIQITAAKLDNERRKQIAELEEEKLNMQISLTDVRESIGRISAFIENIEPRSHEAVITFNQCMEICTAIDEMDLPEFEFKGGAE